MRQGKIDSAPTCPHCKHLLDGFTHPTGDATPSAGDVSVCCYCAECIEFTDSDTGLKLVPLTEETAGQIDLTNIQKCQLIARAIITKKNSASEVQV